MNALCCDADINIGTLQILQGKLHYDLIKRHIYDDEAANNDIGSLVQSKMYRKPVKANLIKLILQMHLPQTTNINNICLFC